MCDCLTNNLKFIVQNCFELIVGGGALRRQFD